MEPFQVFEPIDATTTLTTIDADYCRHCRQFVADHVQVLGEEGDVLACPPEYQPLPEPV